METMIDTLPAPLQPIVICALAILFALAIHQIALVVVGRLGKRFTPRTEEVVLRRLRGPTRWLLVAFTLTAVQPALDLPPRGETIWSQVAGIVMPALFGWLAIAIVQLCDDLIQAHARATAPDNVIARQRRTQAAIMARIVVFVLLLVTVCMMLMSVPAVRSIGVTLAASAGLAALAVGAAAQPALKNVMSGIQMAFAAPIRLDDVVIIDGEWGKIEEIRLTYVVVRIWDDRRLVVPVSKFLEDSFQNWTRSSNQLLGSVFWYVDPATDVSRLRAKLRELVESNPRWDKRFCNLQVTDMKANAIELRALMTARDASSAFDLRCDVREAMMDFIRREMPEAIVRQRTDLDVTRPVSAHVAPAKQEATA